VFSIMKVRRGNANIYHKAGVVQYPGIRVAGVADQRLCGDPAAGLCRTQEAVTTQVRGKARTRLATKRHKEFAQGNTTASTCDCFRWGPLGPYIHVGDAEASKLTRTVSYSTQPIYGHAQNTGTSLLVS
jgi:hypothetical protein